MPPPWCCPGGVTLLCLGTALRSWAGKGGFEGPAGAFCNESWLFGVLGINSRGGRRHAQRGEAQHFGAGAGKDAVPAGMRDIIRISKETASSLAEDSRLVGDCGIPQEPSL